MIQISAYISSYTSANMDATCSVGIYDRIMIRNLNNYQTAMGWMPKNQQEGICQQEFTHELNSIYYFKTNVDRPELPTTT